MYCSISTDIVICTLGSAPNDVKNVQGSVKTSAIVIVLPKVRVVQWSNGNLEEEMEWEARYWDLENLDTEWLNPKFKAWLTMKITTARQHLSRQLPRKQILSSINSKRVVRCGVLVVGWQVSPMMRANPSCVSYLEETRAVWQANHSKSIFFSTMSHEICTPLNAILGMTQVLMDTQLTDEQCDTVSILHCFASLVT